MLPIDDSSEYSKVIELRKRNAENFICAGWELIDRRAVGGPSGRDQTALVYVLGWPRNAGIPAGNCPRSSVD